MVEKMSRGKHRSATSDLDLSLKWLESVDSVKKVVLGKTENCRHRYPPGHLRFKHESEGGFKINGYSGNGVIDIFVRCDENSRDEILEKIQSRYGRKKKK